MSTTKHLTADWTVNDVAAAFPATLRVFGRYGVDSCCGGLKSLRTVADAHGFVLDQLLLDLESAIAPEPLVLDVRPDIRAGREPFATIMATVQSLGADQDLVLLNDFEPVPLYSVMKSKGFAHQTEQQPDGAWKVVFSRA